MLIYIDEKQSSNFQSNLLKNISGLLFLLFTWFQLVLETIMKSFFTIT